MAGRNAIKRTTPRKASGTRESRASGVPPASTTTAVAAAGGSGKAPNAEIGDGGNGRWADAKRFFKSVAVEWRRVTWPDKNQLRAATMAVLFTLIIFASYLGVLDWILIRFFTGGRHH